jgi:hypothetical protein
MHRLEINSYNLILPIGQSYRLMRAYYGIPISIDMAVEGALSNSAAHEVTNGFLYNLFGDHVPVPVLAMLRSDI